MTRPLPTGAIIKVAGVTHRQDVVRTVKVGDPVTIYHDPTNGADENACAITTADGQLLGYVPRAGGLAERLAVPAPNGRWSGHIDEVLTGDIWGLRVKLGPFVETTTPSRAGDRVTGRRGSGGFADDDGTPLPDDESPTDEPSTDEAPAGPSTEGPDRLVHARSGRLLGVLIAVEGGKVRVRNAAGVELTYPAAVVRITDA